MKQTVDMRSIGRKSNTSAKLRTSGIIADMPMQYPNVIQLNNSMWPYVPYVYRRLVVGGVAYVIARWGGGRTAVSYELEIKA